MDIPTIHYMSEVFITRIASYLPNEPVLNDDIENHLGKISGNASRVRSIVLRQNGIKKRHYAIDTEQNITHTNAELAAISVKKILGSDNPEMLFCATSNADQLISKKLSLYSFTSIPKIDSLHVKHGSLLQ